jgi:hypothetical protein
LNKKITQKEIVDCIRRLKNNKAHGDDHVINEYIKSTSDKMIELFNMIVETGIIPDSWLVIYIKHIYKNKGDKLDPNNFKPIMILSCVSKLFTAILNERLNKFSNDILILSKNKTGFRKGYSTIDNLFIVHFFFEILKKKKKKIYCCFIDFDKVWRDGLWYKLLLNNINGNMHNVILNMYTDTKFCIVYNNVNPNFVYCNNGVREGENMPLYCLPYI